MDDQSLQNVLSLLRRIQSGGQEITAINFIKTLATGQNFSNYIQMPSDRDADESSVIRIAAYIIDQVKQARVVIDNSQLVEEAKAGVRASLDDLLNVFSLGRLGNGLSEIAARAPGYISNFVILLSSAGFPVSHSTPKEADDLASEIDAFLSKFDDEKLDPVVRQIAKKHMALLSMLLRHIPIFGLEPAMQTYFEMVMKMRRADSKSSEDSKTALNTVLSVVKTWKDRIISLDEVVNSGASLLERAQVLTPLLQYLP